VTLVALMYGVSLLPSWSGAVWILGGVLGLAGFMWWENRATCPVLDLGPFRTNALFARTNLAALVFYAATSAVPFLLSLHLQGIRGLSPREAGWILTAQPIFMASFSPVAGRLSDRVRPATVASWGLVLVTCGLLILAVIGTETSLVWIVFGLLVLGLGYALFSSPNSSRNERCREQILWRCLRDTVNDAAVRSDAQRGPHNADVGAVHGQGASIC
jgi:predicted MFS family arabinose efflux permease